VSSQIRVGIVDADSNIATGRQMVLESTGRITIVLSEKDPLSLVEKFEDYLIDVLVVEQRLQGISGVDLVQKLSSIKFAGGSEARILVTAAFGSSRLTFDALMAGASAVVTQDQGSKKLIDTVIALASRKNQHTFQGLRELVLELEVAMKVDPGVQVLLDSLKETERALLWAVLEGESISSVATRFDLAGYRVRKIVERAMNQLHTSTLEQLQLRVILSGESV